MMWPLLLELCERQVDILAIQQFPSCMVVGLACGGIPVFGSVGILNRVARHKLLSKGEIKFFKPKREFFRICLNVFAPVSALWLIPKLIGPGSDTPSGSSVFGDFLKQMALIVGGSVACIQGFCSARRCIKKIKQANKIRLSEQQQVQVREILPLLPVHIKESTVSTTMAYVPTIARATVIGTHIYPLIRAQGHGAVINSIVLSWGVLSWFHFDLNETKSTMPHKTRK